MTNLMKRSLALVMALVLCLSLLPATAVPVNAASYIYNWGTRGTLATSLSSNAEAFYTGNNTYDALSALAGGTSKETVPNSALYSALQKLMADAHSYETSYDATKDLYQYTDCQNGGGKISSFYSGKEIGPAWDSNEWNREHTWPNSKGDASGNGENDIMMLRPTAVSENGSRSNTAYGESGGYYHPNTESGGAYDVRGDVARIMLYVYVRWGNTGSMWGSSGVIESPEVMFSWMQADPVDTWEMGRNDSVQSITGTRNVFVDYPELAFKLFGEEIPADMTTPSNKAAECQHNYVDGVCSSCGAEQPVVTATVDKTITFDTNKTQRTSFSSTQQVWQNDGVVFTNDKASSSNAVADYSPVRIYAKSSVTIAHPGMTQIVFVCNASKYVTPLTNSLGDATYTVDGNNVTVTLATPQDTFTIASISAQTRFNSITVTVPADAVTCQHTNTEVEGAKDATCTETGHTGKTVCSDCGEIVDAGEEISVIDHTYVDGICSVCGAKDLSGFEETTATVTFADKNNRTEYSTDKQVWVENGVTVTNEKGSSTNNVYDTVSPIRVYQKASLTVAYNDMTEIEFTCSTADYATALKNSISDGTVTVNEKVVTVKFGEPVDELHIASMTAQSRVSSITVTAISCSHADTTVEGKTDATCTEAGYTGDTVCTVCGATVTEGEVIEATGHNYVDGTCTACGEKEPVEVIVPTITFDDAAKRTLEEGKQIWTENGITVTNVNGTIGDYVAPVRFYKNSSVKVEYPGMTKIEFVCNTAAYATALKNSISGVTATVNENTVTVILAAAQDSFEIAALADQVRLDSISVGTEVCEHAATTVQGKTDPTCTVNGYSGDTVCDTCGAIVTLGEDVAATGHTFVDGKCACGAVDTSNMVKVEKELSFATTAQRTSLSDTQQVWKQNGITFTNDKASSQNNVVDTSNPVRLYAGSAITVAHASMTKIEFVCNSTSYAEVLAASIGSVASVSDTSVIVELGVPQDSYVIEKLTAQVRVNSIKVTVLEAAAAGCEHTNTKVEGAKDATCTETGHTGKTVCTVCDETIDAGSVTDRLPHTFVDGKCSVCGANEPETSLVAGTAYKFGMTQYNLENKVYYLAGGMDEKNTYYMATTENAAAAIDVYVEETEGGYYFYTMNGEEKLYINMVVNGTYVNGAYEAAASTSYTFNAEKGTLIATVDGVDYWFGTRNDMDHTTMGPVKVEYAGFYGMFYTNLCEHANTTVEGAKDATCTEEGYTGDTVCAACGEVIVSGEKIPVTEHAYVDGICSDCGAEKPAEVTTVTITFDDVAKITDFDETSHSIWEENNIVVTNSKGGYTNKLVKYANPARFYAQTGLKIEYAGMTEIVFACNTASYATALANSIGSTAVVDGKVVTVKLSAAQDVFEIASFGAQVRMDSITITASTEETPDEPVCEEHSFVDGVCSVCGHKLGDINDDGTVTYQDAVYILLANMYPSQYSLDGVYADVDGSGAVDQDDAVYLLLHTLFGENFYPLRTPAVLPENEEESVG